MLVNPGTQGLWGKYFNNGIVAVSIHTKVLSPECDLRPGHQCLKGIVCLSLGVLAVGGVGFQQSH